MHNPEAAILWLLDSDPSIRWQTMRDLLDLPETQWGSERQKVESEGWGAGLLRRQDPDGQWAGGAFVPSDFDWSEWDTEGQPWTATSFVLSQLREFGLDPACESAKRTVDLIARNSKWDHAGEPFWEGEVEECINGRVLADGAYFGVDVKLIAERLVADRQPDGGWNCERVGGSLCSSFATTINVLEGLLEYEKATGGTPESKQARASGEAYLLKRHLFRRLTTGDPADERFLQFLHPNRWHYDVLRALDYFRTSSIHDGTAADLRLRDAIEHVRSRQRPGGTWVLDWQTQGRVWFEVDDSPGTPSKWLTLRALRVLKWWDDEHNLKRSHVRRPQQD